MNTELLQKLKNEEGLALVEFYATWCPHCRKMIPVMAQVKKEAAGHVSVYLFDVDEYSDLADELGAKSLPTFILYDGGREVWRHAGELTVETLMDALGNA